MRLSIKLLMSICSLVLLSACFNTVNIENMDKIKAAKLNTELGLQYLAMGNLSLAKTKLDKAQNLVKISETELALALYFTKVKEFSVAEQYYVSVLKSCQDCTQVYQQYARFLCEQKKCNQANKYFALALADLNYPRLGSIYVNAAKCAQECGDMVLAAKYWSRALDYNEKE